MSLDFPAFGGLYYHRDLRSEKKFSLPDERDAAFCIGPIAHYSWWHGNRRTLNVDRGPCK